MRVPVPPPNFDELFASVLSRAGTGSRALAFRGTPTVDGKYRHWDVLRRLPAPEGLTTEEWWLGIKMARMAMYQLLPLRDRGGVPFRYALPAEALRMLHEIDRDASGTIRAPEQVTNPQTRDAYLFRSLLEEAITSSQLEGAQTTREVARDMIKRGREPQDRSERMIFNNYRALLYIRDVIRRPLSKDILLKLQEILTEGTLDDPDAAGRFRRPDEAVCVSDEVGTVLHTPPDAAELDARCAAMCRFANETDADPFIHPVVRAVLLHFWLAYDHPFVDGNGRTARALFYWSMARQGYWLAEFLAISRIIKMAPARYGRSFLYTESDDNDATYFILAQLHVTRRAITDLHAYLAKKAAELRRTAQLIQYSEAIRAHLNHRQLALVSHALKHPYHEYTIESHRTSHGVAYATARADLFELARHQLLRENRIGRTYVFTVPPDLHERLSAISEPAGPLTPRPRNADRQPPGRRSPDEPSDPPPPR